MFSRKRGGPKHVRPTDAPPSAALERSLAADDEAPPPTHGPWDAEHAPEGVERLDLGSLQIPAIEGVEVRVQASPDGGVEQIVLVDGDSALQLGVFAAPRSEGIWDEIRAEIAAGVTRQGGTADEVPGPFGRELVVRVPVRSADGRTGHQAQRFVGVDGPRWFLRAVIQGPAVHDQEAAGTLESVVRDVVVVRGGEAMAPREVLALRLPQEVVDEATEAVEEESRPPLEPFRRGPEITEIR
jgi:hypothetical protein